MSFEDRLVKEKVMAGLFGTRERPVRVGRYTLIERIGSGGMGEVYAAYDDKLDRKVALKVMRNAQERLLAEAQALAKLSHPNVVHVYEVGAVEDRVFIAMEFVRGATLGAWAKGRDPRALLPVLLAAGRGLEAAHASGLVHRDFKPDNVLVGDDGRTRVIDFGLARDAAEEDGAREGTPAYMSPEQKVGRAVDVRSDQYSFCLTARELLGDRAPGHARRAIERGLAEDPSERHADMGALLTAFARDPAATRRRAAASIAVVSIAGAALASIAVPRSDPCASVTWPVDQVWNPTAAKALRRSFAGTGLAYAEASWTSFSAIIDRYADDWRRERISACKASRDRPDAEVIERSAFCLDGRARRMRGLLESFAAVDASAIERAVEAAASLPSLDLCRNLEALRLGVQPPDDAAAVERVAEIRDRLARGWALDYRGRYAEGVELADRELGAAVALGYAPLVAEAKHVAGRLRLLRGAPDDIQRGRAILLDAVDLAEGSRDDELAADVWSSLAYLKRIEAFDAPLFRIAARRALAASERIGGQGMRHARALNILGGLAYVEADYRRALALQEQATVIAERNAASPVELVPFLQDLANTHEALANNDAARPLYARALESAIAALGPDHARVARLSMDFATFLTQAGDFAHARALLARVLAIAEAIHGAESAEVADACLALANLEQQIGALDDAMAHGRRSLELRRRLLPAGHPDLAEPLTAVALVHFRQRAWREAHVSMREALELHRAALGDRDLSVGIDQNNLGEVLVRLGRFDEAMQRFAAAERIFRATGTEHPVLLALPAKGRGLAELERGRAKPAIAELERALELFRRHPGYPLELADTAWALARAIRASGRGPDARTLELAEEAERAYALQGEAGEEERAAIRAWRSR